MIIYKATVSLFCLLLSFSSSAQEFCENKLIKVVDQVSSLESKDKYKSVFITQTFVEDEVGEPLKTTIWRDGSRYELNTPFLKVLVDKEDHAFIIRDSKEIVLRSNDVGESPSAVESPAIAQQISELLNWSTSFSCNETPGGGNFILNFPSDKKAEMSFLKSYRIDYKKDLTVSKIEMEYFPGGEYTKYTVNYLSLTEDISGMKFSGSVEEYISKLVKSGSESGYKIKDLRNHK